MNLILSNVRVKEERLGDFRAQRASLLRGKQRLEELCIKYGKMTVLTACSELMNLSEQAFRDQIIKFNFPKTRIEFEDYLDSNGITDTPIKIKVSLVQKNGKIKVSFKGTDPQQLGNVNTPRSVTYSCVYYVFRSLTDQTIMTNAGLFRNIDIEIPDGSLLDPQPPAAVSSGNVETSQRIVDVLLGALSQVIPEIPAASQGTMNNVTIGGFDIFGNPFSYYETIGGGAGAGKNYVGLSAVHVHMTNTRNTPIEAFELAYPLRILKYEIRKDSGGKGSLKGGDGIIREIECLVNSTISLQTERRIFEPFGLHGGENGSKGVNMKKTIEGKEVILPGRFISKFVSGEKLIIKTPGGGGYGRNS